MFAGFVHGAAEFDAADLDNMGPIRYPTGKSQVLRGKQNGQPHVLEFPNLHSEVRDHDWSQAFNGLVEQDQRRVAHQARRRRRGGTRGGEKNGRQLFPGGARIRLPGDLGD